MDKLTQVVALAALGVLTAAALGCSAGDAGQTLTDKTATPLAGDAALTAAYEERSSGVLVEAAGTVTRILADDDDGSRHQRFIVRLASGQTLLVAHNIDVAPRVDDLRVGDTIAFRGEYEWSPEGGTVHWTHRDPDGEHSGGWLRHEGHIYE